MQLKEAVPFLKGAINRAMPGGAASRYIVYEGWIYAQSPAIIAAYPVPHMLGCYALAADDLEGALGRMESEPTLAPGDGCLILRSGRLRTTIQLLEAEPPATTSESISDNMWAAMPAGLMDAMRAALPFVAKEGTWQRGVRIEAGRVLAINNRCSIEVALADFAPAEPSILTSETVEYLAKLDEPSEAIFGGDYVMFRWANQAWARIQAMATEWPGIVDRVLGDPNPEPPPIALSAEWRAAFADAAALGDGNLEISPGGILARSSHAEHDAGFTTGVERTTYWSLEALKPVFGVAEAWDPDAQGAARFAGKSCRGVVMGQRR